MQKVISRHNEYNQFRTQNGMNTGLVMFQDQKATIGTTKNTSKLTMTMLSATPTKASHTHAHRIANLKSTPVHDSRTWKNDQQIAVRNAILVQGSEKEQKECRHTTPTFRDNMFAR